MEGAESLLASVHDSSLSHDSHSRLFERLVKLLYTYLPRHQFFTTWPLSRYNGFQIHYIPSYSHGHSLLMWALPSNDSVDPYAEPKRQFVHNMQILSLLFLSMMF